MAGLPLSDAIPQRLSNPRTNRSSPLPVYPSSQCKDDLSSSTYAIQQDYFGDYAAVTSSKGKRRSRRKSRSRIRAYLQRQSSENVHASSDEGDSQTTLTGAARDVKKRLSRTGSSLMQLQSAKSSTARLSGSSSSGIVPDGVSEAEETAAVAHQIKERAYNDRLAAQNHVSSPTDGDKHVDSIMAPLRRKSLYTPGLATRNTSDILKKPSQVKSLDDQPDLSYYYDPARPKESPLSQLAALHISGDGRATPSDIDYPQLGGLQLGTLRVTNGAASPIPRFYDRDLTERPADPDSRSTTGRYHTRSNLGTTCVHDHSSKPCEQSHSPRPPGNPTGLEQAEVESNARLPTSAPHIWSGSTASMAQEYICELGGGPFASTQNLAPNSIAAGDFSMEARQPVMLRNIGHLSNIGWRSTDEGLDQPLICATSQQDALRKLGGMSPALTGSRESTDPFIVDSGSSFNVSVSGDYTGPVNGEKHDQAHPITNFFDYTNHLHEVSVPSTLTSDVRYTTSEDTLARFESQPSDLQWGHTKSLSPRQRSRLALEQSGHPLGPMNLPITSPLSPSIPPNKDSDICLESSSVVRVTTRSLSSGPLRKLQKARPKPQNTRASIVVQGYREVDQGQIPRVPSLVAARHADRLHQFPLLDHTYPSPQHTDVADYNLTAEYLSIRFPSPANVLETDVEKYDIASAKVKRNKRSYSLAVPKFRESSRAEEAERNAKDIVRSPSWSDFRGSKARKEQRSLVKSLKEEERRMIKEERDVLKRIEKETDFEKSKRKNDEVQKHARSRSTSRIRGRTSRRSSQHEMVATIADFGTVTESLGSNPYDIATMSSKSPPISSSRQHPHQMSIANSRPEFANNIHVGSLTIMSSPSLDHAGYEPLGAEFKAPCHKYQDVVVDNTDRKDVFRTQPNDQSPIPALAAIDIKLRDFGQSHSNQRSRSVEMNASHVGSFNDRGGLPRRSMQSRSILRNAPVIPSLPSVQQDQQQGVLSTSSRPQSMVSDPSFIWPSQSRGNGALVPLTKTSNIAQSPRQSSNSDKVPGLWSNGSIERKDFKPVDIPSNKQVNPFTTPKIRQVGRWAAQSQAWSQRRKSAGEALLRSQMISSSDQQAAIGQPMVTQEKPKASQDISLSRSQGPSGTGFAPGPQDSSASTCESLASHSQSSLQQLSPFAPSSGSTVRRPMTFRGTVKCEDHQPLSSQSSTSTRLIANAANQVQNCRIYPLSQPNDPKKAISRNMVGSGVSTSVGNFERLSGRYEGGLLFGYEPGSGLGGSAGTRGTKSEASRKSVDVSRGWGLDLSDVPVFVTPTHAC